MVGSDTDVWVYGMALMGCGWLDNKTVYVETSINSEYVSINAILEATTNHPKLKKIQFPTLTLATLYIITGGDYISSFFRTSKHLSPSSLKTLNIFVIKSFWWKQILQHSLELKDTHYLKLI